MKKEIVRNHTHVSLTSKYLTSHFACYRRDWVRSLLPARISTDPEENIPLALKVIAYYERESSSAAYFLELDLSWLLMEEKYPWSYDDQNINDFPINYCPSLVAQYLAIWADLIASKKHK